MVLAKYFDPALQYQPSERALIVMRSSSQDPEFRKLIRVALFDSHKIVVEQAVRQYLKLTPEEKEEIVSLQMLETLVLSIGGMRWTAAKLLSGRKDVGNDTVRQLFEGADDSDTREALCEYYRALTPEEKRELLSYDMVYDKTQHARIRDGGREFWTKLFIMFPGENEEEQKTIRQVTEDYLLGSDSLTCLIETIRANEILVSPDVIDHMASLYAHGYYDESSFDDVVGAMEKALDLSKIDSAKIKDWTVMSSGTKQALIVRLILSGKGEVLGLTSYDFLFSLMIYANSNSMEKLINEINTIYRSLSLEEKKLVAPVGPRIRRGTLLCHVDEGYANQKTVYLFCYGRTDLSTDELKWLWDECDENEDGMAEIFREAVGSIISQRIKDGYNKDIDSFEGSIREAVELEKKVFGETDTEALAYVQKQICAVFSTSNLSDNEVTTIMTTAEMAPEYMFYFNVSDEWKRQQIMSIVERAVWNDGVISYIKIESSIWELIPDDFIVALSKDIHDTAVQAHMLAIEMCAARNKVPLTKTVLGNVFPGAHDKDEITLAIRNAIGLGHAIGFESILPKILRWMWSCPGYDDLSIRHHCLEVIEQDLSTN